jgi:hypothetical protein
MVYPRLVFFVIQQDTPFLLLESYTTNKHSSKDVADQLLVGGDELWRAMVRRWCVVTSHSQDCTNLFEQLRQEIDS